MSSFFFILTPAQAAVVLAAWKLVTAAACAKTQGASVRLCLNFADKNGNPIGPTMPLNLAPGTGTLLDLRAAQLGLRLGQRVEVQPIINVTAPTTAGPPLNSVCQVSVEVLETLTGRTQSYQSAFASLPAAQ